MWHDKSGTCGQLQHFWLCPMKFGMDSIKDSSMALHKAYVWQTQVVEFLLVFVHIFIVNTVKPVFKTT